MLLAPVHLFIFLLFSNIYKPHMWNWLVTEAIIEQMGYQNEIGGGLNNKLCISFYKDDFLCMHVGNGHRNMWLLKISINRIGIMKSF